MSDNCRVGKITQQNLREMVLSSLFSPALSGTLIKPKRYDKATQKV